MSISVTPRVRPLILSLLVLGVLSPGAAWAGGSLAHFAGKGAGYFLLSQGGVLAASGTVNPKVTASAKKATFRLATSTGSPPIAASQTISLKNGRARIDHLLPGFSGFEASASGTYKVKGNSVRATLPFSYVSGGSTVTGTLLIEIETTSFGTLLRISSQLIFQNGSKPIVMTVFAT